MNPIEILFKGSYHKENKPLFSSQKELAEEIIKIYPKFKDRELNSALAYLNYALRGKRPLKPELFEVIITICKGRIKNSVNLSEFTTDLQNSIDGAYDKNKAENTDFISGKHADIDFKHLLECQEKALRVFIMTHIPAEISKSKYAERLRDQLIESLNIVEKEGNNQIKKYIFFLPKREMEAVSSSISYLFWKGIYKHLQEMGISDIEKKLLEINDSNSNSSVLRVFEINPEYTWLPVAIYNIGSEDETAFLLSYKEKGGVSAAEFSKDILNDYRRYVLSKFINLTSLDINADNIEIIQGKEVKFSEFKFN